MCLVPAATISNSREHKNYNCNKHTTCSFSVYRRPFCGWESANWRNVCPLMCLSSFLTCLPDEVFVLFFLSAWWSVCPLFYLFVKGTHHWEFHSTRRKGAHCCTSCLWWWKGRMVSDACWERHSVRSCWTPYLLLMSYLVEQLSSLIYHLAKHLSSLMSFVAEHLRSLMSFVAEHFDPFRCLSYLHCFFVIVCSEARITHPLLGTTGQGRTRGGAESTNATLAGNPRLRVSKQEALQQRAFHVCKMTACCPSNLNIIDALRSKE